MRRHVTVSLFVLVIAVASVAEAQRVAPAGPMHDVGGVGFDLPLLATTQAQPQQPPPPPPRPRRRASMVGYVEDAVIESKFRVRLDTAFENKVPDRAEFFYAKCGCYQDLAANDPANDPDAPGPRPGIPTDLNFQQLHISGEYAFSNRFSAFGQLPFRWIQPQGFIPGSGAGFENHGGVEDLRVGVKVGLVASDEQSITGQVRLYFATGDASRGLSTDHTSFEPTLLYYQRLNDIVAVESQIGVWLPLNGAAPVPTQAEGSFAGDVFSYGIGPSFTVYNTDRVRFAPVVELVGWRVLNGHQTAADFDASGTNIVNLKLGARTVFPQGSLYVGYGFALTDQSWYDDVLRFEYRYDF